jgi:hypothetical protein
MVVVVVVWYHIMYILKYIIIYKYKNNYGPSRLHARGQRWW